ncbi:hypothetical protein BDR07DRAFT_1381509 [Suillus spraguei]|nr:hypothetical protein BDR07DRAFT_1381509 [Suillus spraguei]
MEGAARRYRNDREEHLNSAGAGATSMDGNLSQRRTYALLVEAKSLGSQPILSVFQDLSNYLVALVFQTDWHLTLHHFDNYQRGVGSDAKFSGNSGSSMSPGQILKQVYGGR